MENETNDILKKLYIEPTSRCNLACTMCFRNTWVDEPLRDMERELFDRVLFGMPEGVETIFFGGMGEPLAHKDILYMVENAARRGKRVELLTNATLLTQDMSAALIAAGLNMLWVSIDSLEEEGYENIRKGSNLSLITKHLRLYNLERARRRALRDLNSEERDARLGLTFVAMKSNVHMLSRLAHFAAEYNVNEVNISNMIPTDAASQQESLYARVLSFSIGANAAPAINLPYMDFKMPEVQEGLAGLLGTDSRLTIGGVPLGRRNAYCRFIEEGTAFVRHDGDVSPCMALLHSAVTYFDGAPRTVWHHAFGNPANMTLAEIWNSDAYADFRERVRNFTFSPCMHCGGCENRSSNRSDCVGNPAPTCGACLWSEGIIFCP